MREESSSLSLAGRGHFIGKENDNSKDGDLEINDSESVATFIDFLPDQEENMDTMSPQEPLFLFHLERISCKFLHSCATFH